MHVAGRKCDICPRLQFYISAPGKNREPRPQSASPRSVRSHSFIVPMERPVKSSGWENVKTSEDQALFADVSAESPVTEIESLCMACHEQVRAVPAFRFPCISTRYMLSSRRIWDVLLCHELLRSVYYNSLHASRFAQGTTRMLLTKVPFFRDIILMSFSCPHCNYRNNEVQSATSIEEKVRVHTLSSAHCAVVICILC